MDVDLGYRGHVQDGKARFMEALAIIGAISVALAHDPEKRAPVF
jgi:uncharacterized membrane-anchored protein